jgi:hypothetical protein
MCSSTPTIIALQKQTPLNPAAAFLCLHLAPPHTHFEYLAGLPLGNCPEFHKLAHNVILLCCCGDPPWVTFNCSE